MIVGKERGRKARRSRALRVPFQTREATAFPLVTLNAAAAWYTFTAFSSAVETLHLL
jgi:hypothetical protein